MAETLTREQWAENKDSLMKDGTKKISSMMDTLNQTLDQSLAKLWLWNVFDDMADDMGYDMLFDEKGKPKWWAWLFLDKQKLQTIEQEISMELGDVKTGIDKIQQTEPPYDKKSLELLRDADWSELPKDGYLDNEVYVLYLHRLEWKHKLPLNTLVEVCRKESNWVLKDGDQPLGSSAGAQWLFQFMPNTAKDRYKKVDAPHADALAKNPIYAAEAAALYLSHYGYKDGETFSMQKALIAYNNGPGYMNEPLDTRPPETQDYYKIISANVWYA